MSYQTDVATLASVFGSVQGVTAYHYHGPFGEEVPPFLRWEEVSGAPALSDDGSTNGGWEGFVHLFTPNEGDPIADAVTAAMDAAGMVWAYEQVAY